jgi:hypothetical protein
MRARAVDSAPRCQGCRRAEPLPEKRLCPTCRERNLALPAGIAFGEWVAIQGESGVFRVVGFAQDGSVHLYGGSPDPNAHRGSRAVFPERLRPAEAPYRED